MTHDSTSLKAINKSQSIGRILTFIRANSNISFEGALSSKKLENSTLLGGLVYCLGFSFVYYASENDYISIYAGYESTELRKVIGYSPYRKSLIGDLSALISKVFMIIFNLQNRLNDAINYPPDMRRSEIQSVCDEIGIDIQTYRTILSNTPC